MQATNSQSENHSSSLGLPGHGCYVDLDDLSEGSQAAGEYGEQSDDSDVDDENVCERRFERQNGNARENGMGHVSTRKECDFEAQTQTPTTNRAVCTEACFEEDDEWDAEFFEAADKVVRM
jgi:hypothetical protein